MEQTDKQKQQIVFESAKGKVFDSIRRRDYKGLILYIQKTDLDINILRAIVSSNGVELIEIIVGSKLDFATACVALPVLTYISQQLKKFNDTDSLVNFIIEHLTNFNDSITNILKELQTNEKT